MKSNLKIKIIILITLGIAFTLSPIISNNLNFNAGNSDKSLEYSDETNVDNDNLKISAVSGKIYIDDNDPSNNWSNAKKAGICTGNGTYSEPYIIEDLVIDGGGPGVCIEIVNSDVYFKIENCTVYNADRGIKLTYVNNSQLINNNCSSNYRGITVYNSDNNTVSGNTAINNEWVGIALYMSNYNTISGNNLTGNLHNCWSEIDCVGNVFENNDCDAREKPIPGYNLFFLLGILSIVAILVSKKLKKS